jgi:uncharacterized protein YggU (UPF0235/DUF167 family)
VSPGSAAPQVVGRHGDAWKIRVAAPPEGGKANEAVLGLLARTLAIPRRAVSLVAGHGARDKIVVLTGIDAGETERRLASATADAGKKTA